MNICSDLHEEIVYIGRNCPLCQAGGEITDLQQRIEELEKDEKV